MIKTSFNKKYLVVIALLLAILGIKSVTSDSDKELGSEFSVDELSLSRYTLYAEEFPTDSPAKDVFAGVYRDVARESKHRTGGRINPEKAIARQVSPNQQGNQTPPSVTDDEVSRVKLLGIVFHDNKRKAFLALERQRVIAAVGDLVYGRYLLSEMAVDSVKLQDTKDNVSKTIFVSGK